MAIYYWDKYQTLHNSRNFGDDINPTLLGKLFNKSIIESDNTCVVGIGTLIDDQKLGGLKHFEKKIIFSTGAGYGTLKTALDDSWDITCVRGPKTAEFLNVDRSKAVSDGAILLSDYIDPIDRPRKHGILFIPHVNTGWAIGTGLKEICDKLNIGYVAPDADPDVFIQKVNESELLLTEAMHGAIIADSLRTPWIPCSLLFHNQFKWEDWCAAMKVAYDPIFLGPSFEVTGASTLTRGYSHLLSVFRKRRMEKALRRAMQAPPQLSDPAVLSERMERLRKIVQEINDKYG